MNPYWYYVPRYRYVKPKIENEYCPEKITEREYNCFDLGDKAPDFTLDAIVNNDRTKVSLSDFRGKWVVLFFYGSDFTFV